MLYFYINFLFCIFQKSFIHKVGGHTPRENIRNALTQIFSDECSMKCSWKGRRQNFAICKLRLIAIMKGMHICMYMCLTYIFIYNNK